MEAFSHWPFDVSLILQIMIDPSHKLSGLLPAFGVRSKRPQASDKEVKDRVRRLLVLIKRIRRVEGRIDARRSVSR